MKIERSSPEMGKKLWNILKIVVYMMEKNLRNSKLILDLHMLLKRGKQASKALLIGNENYYSILTCRSNVDAHPPFVSAREYEFSCSNTPAHHTTKYYYQKAEEMQKVMLSPLNLPGFGGRSPCTVRQLRVTDSPFSVKDAEDFHEVDKDAEEFIKKFYKELKKQRRVAALESPSPYHKFDGSQLFNSM